jgi:hypothetical protein
LNNNKIFGVIGIFASDNKNYAICVIPGAKNTTSAQLLEYSKKVNFKFNQNFSKVMKTGIFK